MKSSASTTANNKRKISHDDEEENENMEKFYALIKNIREVRDRLIANNSSSSATATATATIKNTAAAADDEGKNKRQKLEEDQEMQAVAWNPAFQREDFVDEADNKAKEPRMSLAGTSQSKAGSDRDDRKEEVKEELDLTLSL
ncbi:hypothetical protein HRI_000335600 [Hibiscus trionum]|uniref:Protein NIM1-INTERACTING 1 n=1 Tax=Hibiscus trionum TaxID=183268 RepID=A0A9W7LJ20_HIBTR|nr:hypothetical protein HRI_000335600 [Hibiscus trionum]